MLPFDFDIEIFPDFILGRFTDDTGKAIFRTPEEARLFKIGKDIKEMNKVCFDCNNLSPEGDCLGSSNPEKCKVFKNKNTNPVSEEKGTTDKYLIHKGLCDELNKTYIRKNHDYGDSFGKGFAEYGMVMPIIRMEDKLNRVRSLVKNGKRMVNDESIRDTLIDLANYALMTVTEIDAQSVKEDAK